jgi:hypothetical protein
MPLKDEHAPARVPGQERGGGQAADARSNHDRIEAAVERTGGRRGSGARHALYVAFMRGSAPSDDARAPDDPATAI